MKRAALTLLITTIAASPALGQRTFGTLVLIESSPIPAGPSPLSAETPAEWRFVELVYASLFSADNNGGYEPVLAAKVTLEDGGRKLIVSLHDEARFSNGRDVSPADVIYTYTLAKEGKWNKAWTDGLRALKSVERHPNGFDVVFEFAVPLTRPQALLTVPIIPSGLHGPLDDTTRQRPLPLGVIGAGPFKLAEDTVKSRLVVSESSLRKPKISEIRILSAGSRRLAADFVRLMGDAVTFDVAPEDAVTLRAEFGAHLIETQRRRLIALAYNPKQSLLKDPIVRRAFDHVVNRSELFTSGEGARTGAAPVDRRSEDYPKGLQPAKFDLDEAERLLWWEGGWQREPHQQVFVRKTANNATEELEVTLLVDADDRHGLRRAWILREQCRRAGIGLKVDPRPRFEFYSRVRSKEFPAALVALDLSEDDDLKPLFHSKGGRNVLNFANPGLDEVLSGGDRKAAVELVARIEPMIFFGITRDVGAAGKNVTIPRVVGRGGMGRVDKWRIQ